MAAGDLVLNMIINATNNTGGTIQSIARQITNLTGPLGILAGASAVTAAAVIGIGAAATKMAADYQQQITTLMTSAGELPKNLKLIQQGILNVSVATGTSTANLIQGMYMIESAGYKGRDALNILTIAAQGAKTENADLKTVATAIVTIMNDYGMQADQSASAMNGLITAVANGTTHLQDMSRAMGMVLPIASSLHVSFADTAGALSMMTRAGVPAQRASMELANALRNLGAPSKVAIAAMQSVGLTADQVKQTLETKGLAAALQLIEYHVGQKFPKDSAAWTTAMKNILGGSNGLTVDLDVGEEHMKDYEKVVQAIAAAMAKGGNSVLGFDLVQQNLNFKLDQAKQAFNALMITIGMAILPSMTKLVGAVTPLIIGFTQWLEKSNALDKISSALGTALDFVFNAIGKGVTWLTQLIQKIAGTELGLNMLKGVGVAALALLAAGFVALGISAAGAAISVIGATLPILAIGAAIALVAGLFMHFYQTSSQFRGFIDGAILALKNFWNMIVANVNPALQTLSNFWNAYVAPAFKWIGDYIVKQFTPLWGQLVNLWKTQLVPAWNEMVEAFKPAMPLLQAFGTIIGAFIVVAVIALIGVITAVIKGLAGFLSGLMSVIKGVVEIIQGALIFIGGMLSLFTDLFTFQWQKLGTDWLKMWDGFVMIMKGIGTTLLGLVRTFWYTVSGMFTGFIDGIVAAFQGLENDLVGHSIIPDMINAIIFWFNKIPTFLTQLITQQLNIIKNGWNIIYNWIRSIMSTIVQFIQQQWNTSVNNVKTALSAIGTVVSTAWNNFLKTPFGQMNTQIFNWFTTLITNFGTWAMNAMKMFGQNITNGIGNVTTALTGVAQTIKNILGFASPPPQGPLNASDKWMPNMMSMFANGINQNTPKITTATTQLANTINLSFANINTSVQTHISGINTQFQLLSTNIQTTSTNIGNNLTNMSQNATNQINIMTNQIHYFTQQTTTGMQQASTAVQQSGNNISNSTQQTTQNVQKAASTMKVTFDKTAQDAKTTVVTVDQNYNDMKTYAQTAQQQQMQANKQFMQALDSFMHEQTKGIFDHLGAAFNSEEMAMTAQVMSWVNSMSMQINSVLGHSVPKEGPLKEDDKWGLHFAQNIANGIKQGTPLVASAVEGLVGVMSLNGSVINSTFGVNSSSVNNQPMIIYNQLDGKTISKVVTNYQQKELRIQGNIRNV